MDGEKRVKFLCKRMFHEKHGAGMLCDLVQNFLNGL